MLSPRPWKLEAVLRLALGVFICLFVGLLLATLLQGDRHDKSPTMLPRIIVSALFFQGASVAFVWRFVREHEMSWTEAFGFRNATVWAVTLGALGTCGFLPVGSFLQRGSLVALERLGIEPVTQSAVEALRNAGQGPGLLAFVLITVVIAPLGEELLFRGVLYPALKYAGFPRLAWWGTSILFAAIHFNLPIFLPLLVLSLLLIWLYEQTDNLLAPLTTHALFNAANLLIFFLNGNATAKLPSQP